jgi:large subunit ribosomal protein L9
MELILLERVEKLGQIGDVVTVKPGYARNFLLPKGKALRSTESNRSRFKANKSQLEAENLEHRNEAEKVGQKIDGTVIVLVRQAGEAGQLYGSVNARDMAEGLTKAGFTLTHQQIRLKMPIKGVGIHSVNVILHPEVTVSVVANVARSVDEAETQQQTGRAVLSQAEEEAREGAETSVDEAVIAQTEEIFEEEAVRGINVEGGPEGKTEDDSAGAEAKDKAE